MAIELNPARRLNSVVDLQVMPGFDKQFQEVVQIADPFVIYTHESQADGAAAAVVTEYLVKLAKETSRTPPLRGFVMPAAKSMVDGQQGRKLQIEYWLFNLLVSAKGLKTYPFTREEDEVQYGMSRDNLLSELRPMAKKMREGYPPSILAGGSVEAGRHDEGCDPEDIHGLQRLKGTDILTLSRQQTLINNNEREIFYVIVGLHGGFRLQSPNRDKRYLTNKGLGTFFGIPERFIPHVQMEAKVGIIISASQMAERFGKDWMKAGKDRNGRGEERVQAINDFVMKNAALLIPPRARGVYSEAIELSNLS